MFPYFFKRKSTNSSTEHSLRYKIASRSIRHMAPTNRR